MKSWFRTGSELVSERVKNPPYGGFCPNLQSKSDVFKGKFLRKWKPEWDALLGKKPDKTLARELGLTAITVDRHRRALKIRKCSKYQVDCAWCRHAVWRRACREDATCEKCRKLQNNETKRAYRKAHPEQVRKWDLTWNEKHPGGRRKLWLAYKRRHPEKQKEWARLRWQRIKSMKAMRQFVDGGSV